jgi:ribosomal protein S17E
MTKLASAFGKDFLKNKDKVRTRTFELGGHTFKVKVPLTSEFEIMQERMKVVDEEKVNKYYQELTKDFVAFKDKPSTEVKCEFFDDDIIVDGRSIKEAAKNKVIAENRITEMFKLLVPEEKDFDMATITYEMIEELFPFAIQMQVVEMVGKTVSPNYEEQKGK